MEKLKIKNTLGDIKKVNDLLIKLEDRWGLDSELLYDLNLVFDELLSNVVFYAFDDESTHVINISISKTDNGEVEATISDDGKEFDPTLFDNNSKKANSLDDIEPGKLGIHLVRSIVDSIDYQRNNERNILKFSISNKT